MVNALGSTSLTITSSPVPTGEELPKLPQEVIDIILNKIAETSKNKNELYHSARNFLKFASPTLEKDPLANKLFSTAVHACNAGTLKPSVYTYGQFINFLKKSDGALQNLYYKHDKMCLPDASAAAMAALCPKLKKLDLSLNVISDNVLTPFLKDHQLSRLSIIGRRVTSNSIQEIAKNPIEELKIRYAVDLKDSDIETILSIKTLKSLILSTPNKLTPQAYTMIASSGIKFVKETER